MEKKYKIDLAIYLEDFVEQAIVDFKDICEIKLLGGNIIISGENELEIDEVFNEFFNYIIGLFNEQ